MHYAKLDFMHKKLHFGGDVVSSHLRLCITLWDITAITSYQYVFVSV